VKIVVLTQNYVPDPAASSFRMKALAEELQQRGHEVAVITGTPNRYSSFELSRDKINEGDKEEIIRIKRPAQSGSVLCRSLGDLVFLFKSLWVSRPYVRSCDVVVATTPHLWIGLVGAVAAWFHRKPLVLDVRDLWPDVMIELGVIRENSVLFWLLKKIERFIYRSAREITYNSPAFASHIAKEGGKTTACITNGIDDEYFKALQTLGPNPVLYNPYTVTYAGNIGMAQDLEPLVEAAVSFEGRLNFRLIGDGLDRIRIQRLIKQKKVRNIEILPPVERTGLLGYYLETDAFFVHLKPIPMFEKTIPSKIFEYAATGKPVVWGLEGTASRVMEEIHEGQWAFKAGDAEDLKRVLEKLYGDLKTGNISPTGYCADALEEKYLRSSLSRRFADIIEGAKNAVR